MSPARAGTGVVAVHALLVAAAWQAGVRLGAVAGHETTPLQVNLLLPSSPSHEPRAAFAAPGRPSAPPALPALPAPSIVVAAAPVAAAPPEALPRASEAVAPALPLAAAAPRAPEPAATLPEAPEPTTLTQARADRQRCPPAPHPAALRERGIEGVVLLRVRVGADGLPAEVNVTFGSGWVLMDQAALTQVRGCRFLPARRGSEPVESWVEFPVRFSLNG